MKRCALYSLILLSLCSQAFAESGKWTTSDIVDYELRLIDPVAYQSFSFGTPDHHLVLATVGAVRGYITAPLWYWEIDKDGILNIKDDTGRIRYRLKKLYEKDGKVGVELSSGERVEYEKRSIKIKKKRKR